MKGYTSAVPNKECWDILNKYCSDWRMLLSPASVRSITKSNRWMLNKNGYAIDNGVYADWSKGRPFNEKGFFKLLNEYAKNADWIVIPDAVGDFMETCKMFMLWYPRLIQYKRPLMFVAQDGIEQNDYATVRSMTKRGVSIFVGGSTEFKLEHSSMIAKICKENKAQCHIGRVNSAKRVRMCFAWGATSFDGSGMSRFSKTADVVSRQLMKLRRKATVLDKWTKSFKKKYKDDMHFLDCSEYMCWTRSAPDERYWNDYEDRFLEQGRLIDAVLKFRSKFKGQNIEIDVFNHLGKFTTIWITPQEETYIQLDLF